jgi:hypothetical protein
VPVVKDERARLIPVKSALCELLEEEGLFPARFHPQAITPFHGVLEEFGRGETMAFRPHPFGRVLSELVHEAQVMEPKVRMQFLLPMKVESLKQVVTALGEDVDLVRITGIKPNSHSSRSESH